MLTLYCVSISHNKAPVRVLEAFSIPNIPKSLALIKRRFGVDGCAILQTCHRTELYLSGASSNLDEIVESMFSDVGGSHQFDDYMDRFSGTSVLEHLFRVAAGLESVIRGENEILHQVIECRRVANGAKALGTALDITFKGAINAGRKVRKETPLARGSVSIANLALKTVRSELGSLKGKKIAVIGAGKMGCLLAKAIAKEEVESVFIANRTFSRAEKLAKKLSGEAVNFDRLIERMSEVDAAICATSSPHVILSRERVLSALEGRPGQGGLFIVDISNPPGVEKGVADLPGVRLIGLEELTDLARKNQAAKNGSVAMAERIVAEGIANTEERIRAAPFGETASELMKWADQRRRESLNYAMKEMGPMPDVEAMQDFSYALMRELLVPFIEELRGGNNADFSVAIAEIVRRR